MTGEDGHEVQSKVRANRIGKMQAGFEPHEGQLLEGLREKAIAHEKSAGVTVNLMGRGFSAPKIIIVHAGEVIMHKGIRMDELEGFARTSGNGKPRCPSDRAGREPE